MNLKQIIATIGTSIEQLLTKVENHNSVADSIIEEVNHAAAKIRNEVELTKKRRNTLAEQMDQVRNEIRLWQKRALTESNSEEKALACVRVLQRFEARQAQLSEELVVSNSLLEELHANLFEVESSLLALHNRRLALVVKDDGSAGFQRGNTANPPDEDNVFASWEDALMEHHLGFAPEENLNDRPVRNIVLEERLAAAKSRLQELRHQQSTQRLPAQLEKA